jgi:hypothetical protein
VLTQHADAGSQHDSPAAQQSPSSQQGEPGKQHGEPGKQQPSPAAAQHGPSGQHEPSGQQEAVLTDELGTEEPAFAAKAQVAPARAKTRAAAQTNSSLVRIGTNLQEHPGDNGG